MINYGITYCFVCPICVFCPCYYASYNCSGNVLKRAVVNTLYCHTAPWRTSKSRIGSEGTLIYQFVRGVRITAVWWFAPGAALGYHLISFGNQDAGVWTQETTRCRSSSFCSSSRSTLRCCSSRGVRLGCACLGRGDPIGVVESVAGFHVHRSRQTG